ncbi:MAG TPA: hypothetical protein VNZ86_06525 [Bacteroidia bacterium]|nr:hypothetical protein [Bacteroidia bacterium]
MSLQTFSQLLFLGYRKYVFGMTVMQDGIGCLQQAFILDRINCKMQFMLKLSRGHE